MGLTETRMVSPSEVEAAVTEWESRFRDDPLGTVEPYERYVEHQNEIRTLGFSNIRVENVTRLSWAVPNEGILGRGMKHCYAKRAYEIGAGKGLWSHLLQSMGVKITPVDVKEGDGYQRRINLSEGGEFTEVFPCSVVVDPEVLFFCWPSLDEGAFVWTQDLKPKKVIYLGEGSSGCTASNSFHELLYAEYDKVDGSNNIVNWSGIWDQLTIWERKN